MRSRRGGARWSYPRIMRVPAWRDLGRPQRADLAIAAVLLAWGLPDVPWWWEPSGHAGSTPVVLGSLGLTLAMSVPFCWRRRFPALVLAAATGVLATRAALGRNEISAFAAVLIGAYGLGAYSVATRRYARWLGWAALAVALVTVAVNHIRLAAAPFALLGAAFVLGDAASARRAETAAAVAAAHQAERTRIARELHDVVAHQLSAIAVQAGAARRRSGQPGRGRARRGRPWQHGRSPCPAGTAVQGSADRAQPPARGAAARSGYRRRRAARTDAGRTGRAHRLGRGRGGTGRAGRRGPAAGALARRGTVRLPHRIGSAGERGQARPWRHGPRRAPLHRGVAGDHR